MTDERKSELTVQQKESQNPRRMVANLAMALGIDIDPDEFAAGVVRTGDKIILPENASIPDVIESLQKEYDAERQKVSVNTTISVPPWDGARALTKAITEELGLLQALEIPATWFKASEPPTEMEVEYELDKTMTVRWGRFALAGMGNAIAETGVDRDSTTGEFHFTVKITTVRRWQARARKILDRTREIAMTESIHKGKAFAIQFYDADGEQIAIPTPKFFRFSPEPPVFCHDLEAAIERNIKMPIQHSDQLRSQGESLKRGVLFAGKYGVGKTMLASDIAQFAVRFGWTFIYVKEPRELPLALAYAKKFQPVVVFCEDVDRVAGLGRTNEVNNLLNQLDGVDSKSAAIFTILTSNHSNRVNEAMRRPGRIDMLLQVPPPDEETIPRMVKQFLNGRLVPDADLNGIAKVLEGFAPAYIKEACNRSTLEVLRRTGNMSNLISGDDLAIVAKEIRDERDLFVVDHTTDGKDLNESLEHVKTMSRGFAAAAKLMGDTVVKASGQAIETT